MRKSRFRSCTITHTYTHTPLYTTFFRFSSREKQNSFEPRGSLGARRRVSRHAVILSSGIVHDFRWTSTRLNCSVLNFNRYLARYLATALPRSSVPVPCPPAEHAGSVDPKLFMFVEERRRRGRNRGDGLVVGRRYLFSHPRDREFMPLRASVVSRRLCSRTGRRKTFFFFFFSFTPLLSPSPRARARAKGGTEARR